MHGLKFERAIINLAIRSPSGRIAQLGTTNGPTYQSYEPQLSVPLNAARTKAKRCLE
jgi:hypothetical protein